MTHRDSQEHGVAVGVAVAVWVMAMMMSIICLDGVRHELAIALSERGRNDPSSEYSCPGPTSVKVQEYLECPITIVN
jgi:hypothetical protein